MHRGDTSVEPIQYTLGKLSGRSVLINVMKAVPNVCHINYNIDKIQLQVCRDYTDLNTFNTDRPKSLSLCPTPSPVVPPRLCLLPSAVAFSFCAKVPGSIYPCLCSVTLAVSPKTSPISSKLTAASTDSFCSVLLTSRTCSLVLATILTFEIWNGTQTTTAPSASSPPRQPARQLSTLLGKPS